MIRPFLLKGDCKQVMRSIADDSIFSNPLTTTTEMRILIQRR